MEEMDWVTQVISELRGLRSEVNLPPAAKVQLLVKDASPEARTRLQRHRELIERLARIQSIDDLEDDMPKGAAQIVLEDVTLALPLADVIDVAQERARLEREKNKAESEIAKLDKKLGNQQFLAKAPEDVIAEQRSRRAETAALHDKLAQALERLAQL